MTDAERIAQSFTSDSDKATLPDVGG